MDMNTTKKNSFKNRVKGVFSRKKNPQQANKDPQLKELENVLQRQIKNRNNLQKEINKNPKFIGGPNALQSAENNIKATREHIEEFALGSAASFKNVLQRQIKNRNNLQKEINKNPKFVGGPNALQSAENNIKATRERIEELALGSASNGYGSYGPPANGYGSYDPPANGYITSLSPNNRKTLLTEAVGAIRRMSNVSKLQKNINEIRYKLGEYCKDSSSANGYGSYGPPANGYGSYDPPANDSLLKNGNKNSSKRPFVIQGEGMGLLWIKGIHRMILQLAFKDKQIYFDPKKEFKKPDLVVRSTHEWFEKSADNYFKNNSERNPLEPFFEYDCPYVSWSGEPLRCHLRPEKLPLLEMNTYKKTPETSKNTNNPYDPSLYEDTIWWKRRLYYFDNTINTHWVPYLLWVTDYFDNFPSPDIRRSPEGQTLEENMNTKKGDFVYIASNCSQNIREDLFKGLWDASTDKGRVHRYGKCPLDRSDIPRQPFPVGIEWFVDNWKIYNNYKFTFAVENSLNPGYVTEKVLMALISNTVPIYYGSGDVFQYFNKDAIYYLNDKFKDPKNPTADEINLVRDELLALAADDSDKGWKKYLRQPVFRNNKVPLEIKIVEENPVIQTIAKELRKRYDEEIKNGPKRYNNTRNLLELIEELRITLKTPRNLEISSEVATLLQTNMEKTISKNISQIIFNSASPVEAFDINTIQGMLDYLELYNTSNTAEKDVIGVLKNLFTELKKKYEANSADSVELFEEANSDYARINNVNAATAHPPLAAPGLTSAAPGLTPPNPRPPRGNNNNATPPENKNLRRITNSGTGLSVGRRISAGKVDLNTIVAQSGNPKNTLRRKKRQALKSYYPSKTKIMAAKDKAELTDNIELMGNSNNAPGYYRFAKKTGGTRRRSLTRRKKRNVSRKNRK